MEEIKRIMPAVFLINIIFLTVQEKEKQLDSGTPENEKDATTEKEGKEKEQEDEKDKESSVLTNGDSEQKAENAESTPSPDDSKKPKKEKVCFHPNVFLRSSVFNQTIIIKVSVPMIYRSQFIVAQFI